MPAVEALLDLATTTRTDLDRDHLHGAITNATTRGKTWPQVLMLVAGMCARGESVHDLNNAVGQLPPGRHREPAR